MVNNQPLVSDTGMAYKKILRLPYSQNAVSFNFSVLDFVAPRRFNYYYQLWGYDTKWIDAGNRNYVAYTNLPPGHYVFKVKAALQLPGNSQVTELIIIIDPPFWRTAWFLALCVLALSGILYAIYRYRINQLLSLQKVRNRIATDLHDDIGTTLTNISILSELSKKNLQQKKMPAPFSTALQKKCIIRARRWMILYGASIPRTIRWNKPWRACAGMRPRFSMPPILPIHYSWMSSLKNTG